MHCKDNASCHSCIWACRTITRAWRTEQSSRSIEVGGVFLQGLQGGFDGDEVTAAPSGSVPTMEVTQSSGASGEIIGQMDASLLEVSKKEAWTA